MLASRHRGVLLGAALAALVCLLYAPLVRAPDLEKEVRRDEGIRLLCPQARQVDTRKRMAAYLAGEGIEDAWLRVSAHPDRLVYTLNTSAEDTNTLDLQQRPRYGVADVVVRLPGSHGQWRRSMTVSRKEILLALAQHGRVTEFGGADCGVSALQQQVAWRQNIVAWAWNLSWGWPDGDAAEWNLRYWDRGTPRPKADLRSAVQDAFDHQGRYAIGCYTATKLTLVQAALDYFQRVHPDDAVLRRIENRLEADGEPLWGIEPGRLWDFEADFDSAEQARAGKLTAIIDGVAAKNFVPGDWVVFVNTDPKTYARTGYEGSNAIYLGGGRFDDYYNDHDHAYTHEEKLDEVYQWRNGVFNRQRDRAKHRQLTADDMARLALAPAAGGLVLDKRVVPLSE